MEETILQNLADDSIVENAISVHLAGMITDVSTVGNLVTDFSIVGGQSQTVIGKINNITRKITERSHTMPM